MCFKMTALFEEKLIKIATAKKRVKERTPKACEFLRTLARCPLIAKQAPTGTRNS